MDDFTTNPDADFNFGGHVVSRHHIVFQTRFSVLFVNLKPFLPNHLLVSPRLSHRRLQDLSEGECADLFDSVRLATIVLGRKYAGSTIGIQDGFYAGQSVCHVHVHIVPRNSGQVGVTLDAERKNRSFEEMREEAEHLRHLFDDAHNHLLIPATRKAL
eukprot:jgi/Antlo1/668/1187